MLGRISKELFFFFFRKLGYLAGTQASKHVTDSCTARASVWNSKFCVFLSFANTVFALHVCLWKVRYVNTPCDIVLRYNSPSHFRRSPRTCFAPRDLWTHNCVCVYERVLNCTKVSERALCCHSGVMNVSSCLFFFLWGRWKSVIILLSLVRRGNKRVQLFFTPRIARTTLQNFYFLCTVECRKVAYSPQ